MEKSLGPVGDLYQFLAPIWGRVLLWLCRVEFFRNLEAPVDGIRSFAVCFSFRMAKLRISSLPVEHSGVLAEGMSRYVSGGRRPIKEGVSGICTMRCGLQPSLEQFDLSAMTMQKLQVQRHLSGRDVLSLLLELDSRTMAMVPASMLLLMMRTSPELESFLGLRMLVSIIQQRKRQDLSSIQVRDDPSPEVLLTEKSIVNVWYVGSVRMSVSPMMSMFSLDGYAQYSGMTPDA